MVEHRVAEAPLHLVFDKLAHLRVLRLLPPIQHLVAREVPACELPCRGPPAVPPPVVELAEVRVFFELCRLFCRVRVFFELVRVRRVDADDPIGRVLRAAHDLGHRGDLEAEERVPRLQVGREGRQVRERRLAPRAAEPGHGLRAECVGLAAFAVDVAEGNRLLGFVTYALAEPAAAHVPRLEGLLANLQPEVALERDGLRRLILRLGHGEAVRAKGMPFRVQPVP
mmetsp:Transcript_1048/g.2452  ORF Transcript_1048/g.2452 Transcript_1048/m.2452 type:complete len:226 (+) Transcript_1048:566-1243(+)